MVCLFFFLYFLISLSIFSPAKVMKKKIFRTILKSKKTLFFVVFSDLQKRMSNELKFLVKTSENQQVFAMKKS